MSGFGSSGKTNRARAWKPPGVQSQRCAKRPVACIYALLSGWPAVTRAVAGRDRLQGEQSLPRLDARHAPVPYGNTVYVQLEPHLT